MFRGKGDAAGADNSARRGEPPRWEGTRSRRGIVVPKLRLLSAVPGEEGHGGEVFACTFTPDGGHVVSGGWDGHLRMCEAGTGRPVTALRAHAKAVAACAVSPGGSHWLSGSLDGMLTIWDVELQESVRSCLAHARPVAGIVFGREPHTLATASWDKTVAVWNLEHEREARPLTGHEDIVAGCAFTPDHRRLLSWSYDGTLRLWEAVGRSEEALATLKGHDDRVTAAAVSPDGRWFASGARDGGLRLWNAQTLRQAGAAQAPDEVRACFFTLDGESLLSVTLNGHLLVHLLPDLRGGEAVVLGQQVYSAALDPSGRRIALGCGDGHV